MSSARISQHAVRRYSDRIDRAASPAVARLQIAEILARGRWRASPRHSMSGTSSPPGTRFVYWAEMPGVCVIVVEGTAVTLVTRQLTRARRLVPPASIGRVGRPRHALRAHARWRWNGEIEQPA